LDLQGRIKKHDCQQVNDFAGEGLANMICVSGFILGTIFFLRLPPNSVVTSPSVEFITPCSVQDKKYLNINNQIVKISFGKTIGSLRY
jgi:hypothetical protein